MNIFVKHIIRLKNTIVRHIRIIALKLQYGDHFRFKKFHFRDNFHVYVEDDGFIEIGKGCFFNSGCSITARKRIIIGDNCIFGENVKIYDHNHCYKDLNIPVSRQGFSSGEVIIGEGCWIGSNVVILKDVHIGKHCVVGAGVIVHKDIPDNTVSFCKQEVVCKKIK